MARTSRSAAQAAAARAKTRTPQAEASDADMDHGTPQAQVEDIEENQDEEDEGNPATSANNSDSASPTSTPARGRSSGLRRRRAGRPPKVRNIDRDTPDDSRDAASDKGTPRKRGGWRGGPRGSGTGRWGKSRGGPSHVSQSRADVEHDEVILPEDPEGETKVDKNGHLQGHREYRVRVFTIEGKGDRLYMLSTEPARCIGFRDSYLFFQKHPNLYKIILTEEAKRDLIERNLIPHSYKGRAIGVVTARAVFREFGAKIIIGGKKVTDDYQVARARANGDAEGELAVPEDQIPSAGTGYDRNRYVAWHGASSVYHSGIPSIPLQGGKGTEGKKRKIVVTRDNWMTEHAQAASRYNTALALARREALNGVYDIHTNMMHYPQIMQPTHARWEQVFPKFTMSASGENLSPGEAHGDDSTNALDDAMDIDGEVSKSKNDTIFPSVPPVIGRNYMVADTYFTGAPQPDMPYPGPDGDMYDIGPRDLTHVTQDVIDELDDYCKTEFYQARIRQMEWKEQWRGEREDGARSHVHISYNS